MIDAELRQLASTQKQYTTELTHLEVAKCPYCLQDYAEAKLKLVMIRDKLEEGNLLIQQLQDGREQFLVDKRNWEQDQQDNLQLIDEKLNAQQSLKREQVQQLNELSNALTYKTLRDHVAAAQLATTIKGNIIAIEAEQNPHIEALDQLKLATPNKPADTVINELVKLKEHQKILLKLLTDKNSFIRKGIIGKTLPFLNRRLAHYTSKLGLPHKVAFLPDLSCEISRNGYTLGHGNLSNGEKKRLNLGLCMAFRDALTYLHSKVNLLLTDEVDGGSLCDFTVEKLADLIKEKAHTDGMTAYCISHNPIFQDRMGKRLYIRKQNGFSQLSTTP
jgi:hypothetical protein